MLEEDGSIASSCNYEAGKLTLAQKGSVNAVSYTHLIGDVGNIVLRDRQHLSENGLLVVVLTLEKGSNTILAGPDIVSRGFVYVREAENLMDECHEVVNIVLDRLYERGITDWGRIKTEIKDTLNDFLWKKMKRNPVILPIIMEV